MRTLEVGVPTWSVDDAGKVVLDQRERLASSDPVESASFSYNYPES
jgi:hypothetical protein